MGFQRIITQPDLQPPVPAVSSAKAIWRNFVDLDRYLGLHLRLPFGADDYPLPEDANLHIIHRSKINALSQQIANLDHEVSPQAYATALVMDEKLESLMRENAQGVLGSPKYTIYCTITRVICGTRAAYGTNVAFRDEDIHPSALSAPST